jgi:uncharacterized protein
MEQLVGRQAEKELLLSALQSKEAELIAVYGRRRVGKTFLIRQVFGERIVLDISGIHNGSMQQQLENFNLILKKSIRKRIRYEDANSWIIAFENLTACLRELGKKQKVVVFFDEFPWLNTRKSGFLPAFENFWNHWATRQKNLVIVICGSAASWMIKNVVNSKGGLHNRITQKIRLLPFTLQETEQYLKSRKVNLDRYQVLQLYMVMGGIPQYLREVKPGQSATQNIDRICFTKDGLLHNEFKNLYRSLFEQADHYIAIIRTLSKKPSGLTRSGIINEVGLSTGGGVTKLLEELEESGFISASIPFDKNIKETIYRLTDEYSLFYLKFMQSFSRIPTRDAWKRLAQTSSWKSWSGYAFESICIKHTESIKVALGINGIDTNTSVWRSCGNKKEPGAQIDLLIDRSDRCINLCEMKYTVDPFSITKSYAAELERKIAVFRQRTKTRKTIFLTMLTTFGVSNNEHKVRLIQNELLMDHLFN